MPVPLVKPVSIPEPFAVNGQKNTIPTASQIGVTPGKASLNDGFPPLTMTAIAQGGVPPSGLDFNGILNLITQHTAWVNAGGQYQFDAALVAAIGGYPAGMVVQSNDGLSSYVSAVNNNSTDFNATPSSIGAQWLPWSGKALGPAAITTTGGTTVLTAAQYASNFIVVSGVLTSNASIIFPATPGKWTVINNTTGAYSVSAYASGGSGVPVMRGRAEGVICDGTNVQYATASAVTQSPGDSSKAQATTEFVSTAVALALVAVPKALQYLEAAATLIAGCTYNVNTSGGPFNLTLPLNPITGDTITLFDAKSTWGTCNLTLLRNGKNIEGFPQDLIVNVGNIEFTIWYNGIEWRLV